MLPFSIGSWEGFWIIFEQNLKESMEQTTEVQGASFPAIRNQSIKSPSGNTSGPLGEQPGGQSGWSARAVGN